MNDMMGGMFGAIAVLAALRDRDRTDHGQYVQSGLFENCAFLVSTHMMQQVVQAQRHRQCRSASVPGASTMCLNPPTA